MGFGIRAANIVDIGVMRHVIEIWFVRVRNSILFSERCECRGSRNGVAISWWCNCREAS